MSPKKGATMEPMGKPLNPPKVYSLLLGYGALWAHGLGYFESSAKHRSL